MSQISTFKTCVACGQSKLITEFPKNKGNKDGYDGCCSVCNRARVKAWRIANPDKHKVQRQRDRDSGHKAARRKRDYAEHKDRYIASAKQWIAEHRESHRSYTRKWGKEHRAFWSWYRGVRKGREEAAGSFTDEEWRALCEHYGNICLCCKQRKPLTVDHVIPLSKGGSNTIDNLQPLCKECNCKKHTKTIDFRF